MSPVTPIVDPEELAAGLKALAEPKRLLIVELLMSGVYCNCELGEALAMAPNLVSHHLGVLRRAGLIDARRDAGDARWVYYSMNRSRLAQLATAVRTMLDPARLGEREPACGQAGRRADPEAATTHAPPAARPTTSVVGEQESIDHV